MDIQWVKKLSQCLAVLKRLTCRKSSKLYNNVKIIYPLYTSYRPPKAGGISQIFMSAFVSSWPSKTERSKKEMVADGRKRQSIITKLDTAAGSSVLSSRPEFFIIS